MASKTMEKENGGRERMDGAEYGMGDMLISSENVAGGEAKAKTGNQKRGFPRRSGTHGGVTIHALCI